MKYLLVVAFAACAFAGALQRPAYKLSPIDDDSEIEVIYENEDGFQEIAPSMIVSWQARRAIRKLQKQMPCGFPQYGIPPLAPLKKSEVSVHYERGILDTTEALTRFRLDGLDDFKINKFKLNVILSKVNFDFTFRNLRASAPNYATNTILNALSQLGISVQYEGNGALDFGLKNLRISGTLKYKIPLLWGSIRITSLKTKIALEGCDSNITGIVGEGKLNELLNRHLENAVVSGINDNQNEISKSIEDNVVPRVNALLKGNDFWDILDLILNGGGGGDVNGAESEDDPIETSCVAPEDPWA